MKKTLFIMGLLVALTVIPINGTFAQEGTTDNWCYPGGPWADGRCQTDWHWNCGWYMAHYESGDLSRAQVEKTDCRSLLPPAPKTFRCLISGEFYPVTFDATAVINGADPNNIVSFVATITGTFDWFEAGGISYLQADGNGDGIPEDNLWNSVGGFDNPHDCSR